jgi:hypothetical protein
MKTLANAKTDWIAPRWPERLPPASTIKTAYNAPADEVTIHFQDESWPDTVVPTAYVVTPGIWYAGVLVRWDSGEIIGVQVDYVRDYALGRHPTWEAIIAEHPPASVVETVVMDIKALFDRYGVETPVNE